MEGVGPQADKQLPLLKSIKQIKSKLHWQNVFILLLKTASERPSTSDDDFAFSSPNLVLHNRLRCTASTQMCNPQGIMGGNGSRYTVKRMSSTHLKQEKKQDNSSPD